MHLKVTVEEGREAELKQQPWDAQLLRALGFFGKPRALPAGAAEEGSPSLGIHLGKSGIRGGSRKVRQPLSFSGRIFAFPPPRQR